MVNRKFESLINCWKMIQRAEAITWMHNIWKAFHKAEFTFSLSSPETISINVYLHNEFYFLHPVCASMSMVSRKETFFPVCYEFASLAFTHWFLQGFDVVIPPRVYLFLKKLELKNKTIWRKCILHLHIENKIVK